MGRDRCPAGVTLPASESSSEYTVRNHLRGVFEKVGMRSRLGLVERLFFENLSPMRC